MDVIGIGIAIATPGAVTTMTMIVIAMTDGGQGPRGEIGACRPVTDTQGGADMEMRIVTVEITATIGTVTVTGIVTLAGIGIEMGTGNGSAIGTEIGTETAADGIAMMIAIRAQGSRRRIHRADIVTGIESAIAIATRTEEGETMIDE